MAQRHQHQPRQEARDEEAARREITSRQADDAQHHDEPAVEDQQGSVISRWPASALMSTYATQLVVPRSASSTVAAKVVFDAASM